MRLLLGLATLILTLPFAPESFAAEKEDKKDEKKAEDTGVAFHRTGRAFIPEQRCSLVVNKGWRLQRDGKSTVLLVPGENGSQANIIISAWETPLTTDQLAKEAAEKMKPNGYQVEKPEAFTTFAKLSGTRLVAKAADKRRVGIQYLFPAGENRILTLTGTFDHKANVNFEQALNLSMKTLHLLDLPLSLPAELGTRFGDNRATIRVPLGWDALADAPGANAFSPPVIHHSEQMFVNFDHSKKSLSEYAAAEAGGDGERGVRIEKAEDFVTEAGVTGLKARGYFKTDGGKELRTVTYYFDGPDGMKVVVGGSAEASEWPAIETLFDQCAKSLKIGPEPKPEEPKKDTI